ncbi:MAG: RpiB/LacA/LacB family sugar-phosphate isomerase [Candidatus Kerfeldbacteria bacterium]|nr:RpiB/LacA/LacB family sugar-phosphate isomerase [Candidatus Kerfeldbacteria bacterium]
MTIFIGADHGGYRFKEALKRSLGATHDVKDLGNAVEDRNDDYPTIALRVAQQVVRTGGRGILVCRSGVGVCIVANKVRGIRAVHAHTAAIARAARRDEDANVLCLGQDHLALADAKRIVAAWLRTPASRAQRHRRRVAQIRRIERTA